MSNKRLRNLLNSVENKVYKANTNQKLLCAVDDLVQYGEPIKFNYTAHKLIAGTFFLLIVSYLFYIITNQHNNIIVNISILSIFTIGFAYPLFICFKDKNNMDELSNLIFKKDKLQDNNISLISPERRYFNYLSSIFPEVFQRGNYSRQFLNGYESNIGRFYSFKYTDSQSTMVPVTTTSTDSNGKTTASTTMQPKITYTHHYRYGFTFETEKFNKIDIEEWKNIFNVDYLKIMNNDNITLIQFKEELLKPSEKRVYGVQSPKEFYRELKGYTELYYYERLEKLKREVSS